MARRKFRRATLRPFRRDTRDVGRGRCMVYCRRESHARLVATQNYYTEHWDAVRKIQQAKANGTFDKILALELDPFDLTTDG